MNKYACFYAVYHTSLQHANPCSKEEVVADFTRVSTTSLGELSESELSGLIRLLKAKNGSGPSYAPASKEESVKTTMRRAIIALFHCAGRNGAEAAKAWAEKQGATIGTTNIKKRFNDDNQQELKSLIIKAEKVYQSDRQAIAKQLSE
jgi:hypothetical protein